LGQTLQLGRLLLLLELTSEMVEKEPKKMMMLSCVILGLIIHFSPFTRFEVIKEFLIEIHFVRKVNKMDHK
jgi:hypothetical protein